MHGDPFAIRFSNVGRTAKELVLYNGAMLCSIGKGKEVEMKSIDDNLGQMQSCAMSIALPTYRKEGGAATATEFGIYICGGVNKQMGVISSCDRIDIPHGGCFTQNALLVSRCPRLTSPRSFATAVQVPAGELYVIGGIACSKLVDIMDAQYSVWRKGPPLNVGRERACAVVLLNRYIVVLGGTRSGLVTYEVEILDTKAQVPVWQVVDDMERPRKSMSAVAVGTDIYMFGGGIPEIDKMSITILEPPVATAPFEHTESRRDLGQDEDQKPAATVSPFSTQSVTDLMKLSADLLPRPPNHPKMVQSFTVAERVEALNSWIVKMELVQATFVNRVEESTQRTIDTFNLARDKALDAFNCARDMKLKEMETTSTAWLEDTQLMIDHAREEAGTKSALLQELKRSTLTNVLLRTDQDDFCDGVPSQLRCPITLNLMVDPVVASDGITYEREALVSWLKKESTSPLSGAELASKKIFPNLLVRSLCEDFVNDSKDQKSEKNRGRSASDRVDTFYREIF